MALMPLLPPLVRPTGSTGAMCGEIQSVEPIPEFDVLPDIRGLDSEG